MMIVLIAHADVIDRESFSSATALSSLRMMAFLFAWLFSIISAIFMVILLNAVRACPQNVIGVDCTLYYLENQLSNFMKSCFKIYAVLHTFAGSPCLLTSALCMLANPLRPPYHPPAIKS